MAASSIALDDLINHRLGNGGDHHCDQPGLVGAQPPRRQLIL